MSPKDYDQLSLLWTGWQDGSLNEHELKELKTLMQDPEKRKEVLEMCWTDMGILEALKMQQQAADIKIQQMGNGESSRMPSLGTNITSISSRMRNPVMRWTVGLPLAAALAISFIIAFYSDMFQFDEKRVTMAHVWQTDKPVMITRGGIHLHIDEGAALKDSDLLTVPKDGTLWMQSSDGSLMVAPGGSRLRLVLGMQSGIAKGERMPWVQLLEGSLWSDIVKQGKSKSINFRLRHLDVEVVGTRLMLRTDKNRSQVDLIEGQVRVQDHHQGFERFIQDNQSISNNGFKIVDMRILDKREVKGLVTAIDEQQRWFEILPPSTGEEASENLRIYTRPVLVDGRVIVDPSFREKLAEVKKGDELNVEIVTEIIPFLSKIIVPEPVEVVEEGGESEEGTSEELEYEEMNE